MQIRRKTDTLCGHSPECFAVTRHSDGAKSVPRSEDHDILCVEVVGRPKYHGPCGGRVRNQGELIEETACSGRLARAGNCGNDISELSVGRCTHYDLAPPNECLRLRSDR